MTNQRITVSTISTECADMLHRTMNANGTIVSTLVTGVGHGSAGTEWTITAIIPCELGNGPLFNVQNMIARYIGEILRYQSEAA